MTTDQNTEESRAEFEQWYVENAFDYVRDPIGSRECGIQWKSWQAARATDPRIAALTAKIRDNALQYLSDNGQAIEREAALRVERDEALARVAALEKDAARYQQVRRGAKWSVIDWKGDDLRGEALDAAIDARISAALPATLEKPDA